MAPPRNRRRKVGSMRIDAALDSMRPMGFPDDVVRKSIKDLLKVYGEDGWIFIEEASYKLLIETIIAGQQEGRAGRDDGSGSGEKSGSLEELYDKEERCQEQKCLPVVIDAEKRPNKNSQTHHHFISKDDSGQPQLGPPPVDFAPTYSPMDRVPTNQTHKPSCGWLDADDEDDALIAGAPSSTAVNMTSCTRSAEQNSILNQAMEIGFGGGWAKCSPSTM